MSVLSASMLGGCSLPIADLPLAGTAANGPPQTKDASGYLPVNELPTQREEAAMNPAERAKIAGELIAARERQASAVAAKDTATKDPTAKDATAKDPTAKDPTVK
jgi:hypothetical protein